VPAGFTGRATDDVRGQGPSAPFALTSQGEDPDGFKDRVTEATKTTRLSPTQLEKEPCAIRSMS
jgi:hypothetical protein